MEKKLRLEDHGKHIKYVIYLSLRYHMLLLVSRYHYMFEHVNVGSTETIFYYEYEYRPRSDLLIRTRKVFIN